MSQCCGHPETAHLTKSSAGILRQPRTCTVIINGTSRRCRCMGWSEPTQPYLIDVEKVEEIFLAWVDDLVAHHGGRSVREVLSSPAIQAMFTGDVGQSVQP